MSSNSAFQIVSSHLALRFYRCNEWTEALLKSCLKQGALNFRDDVKQWGDLSYWSLDHTTQAQFDIDKLLQHAGEVFNYKDELLEGQARIDYLREMNH